MWSTKLFGRAPRWHGCVKFATNNFHSSQAIATKWSINASKTSMRTDNPILKIFNSIKMPANPVKPLIHWSLGDPTVYGSFGPPESASKEIARLILEGKNDNYVPSAGTDAARETVAKSYELPGIPVDPKNVFLTGGGGSGPLEYAIVALADEGENILLPCPGFDKFQTICDNRGIEYEYYNLIPEKQWEIDLEHLESLIDDKTKAILINSPSNPTGAVYPKEHLSEIVQIAERHRLPIIADEIYNGCVFSSSEFHPIRSLTDSVPVLTTGGLSKRFAAPGWRFGWVLIHDPQNRAPTVREGMQKLATVLFAANTVIQAALPEILLNTPSSYFDNFNAALQQRADYLFERFENIPELKPVKPQGAMYIMVQILFDKLDIKTDIEFAQKLLDEEAVALMPGSCFRAPDFMRVVICAPLDKHEDACNRVQAFCERHNLSEVRLASASD